MVDVPETTKLGIHGPEETKASGALGYLVLHPGSQEGVGEVEPPKGEWPQTLSLSLSGGARDIS